MTSKKLFLAFAISTVCISCSSTATLMLKAENKSKIRSVYVLPHVTDIPQKFYVENSADPGYGIGHAVWEGVVAKKYGNTFEQAKQIMDSSIISSISKYLSKDFTITQDTSMADVVVAVYTNYGIGQKSFERYAQVSLMLRMYHIKPVRYFHEDRLIRSQTKGDWIKTYRLLSKAIDSTCIWNPDGEVVRGVSMDKNNSVDCFIPCFQEYFPAVADSACKKLIQTQRADMLTNGQ